MTVAGTEASSTLPDERQLVSRFQDRPAKKDDTYSCSATTASPIPEDLKHLVRDYLREWWYYVRVYEARIQIRTEWGWTDSYKIYLDGGLVQLEAKKLK